MGAFLGALAQQAAGQATGGAIAMGIQRLGVNYDNRKQREQASALQDIQIAGEKQLMDYQNSKQLQMWKDTSYGAQKDQMKQAGINPALMYGMGGGGGQSIGGGMPSVSGGGAQSPGTSKAAANGMGILTSAQIGLINAQADAAKSQAELNRSQVPNQPLTGENIKSDTALKNTQAQSITQGIQNQKAQQLLTESQTKAVNLANDITAASKYDQIATYGANLEKTINEVKTGLAESQVAEATVNEKIQQIKAEAVGAVLDNVLKGTQNDKLKQDIKASIRQLQQTDSQQRIEMAKAGITKMLGERGLDIAQQGVIMGILDKVIGGIQNATK